MHFNNTHSARKCSPKLNRGIFIIGNILVRKVSIIMIITILNIEGCFEVEGS